MASLQLRIARRAGVAQSTVSRGLSGHPSISPATCRRIQQLARQLGYKPNPLISAVFGAMRRRQNCPRVGTLAFLTAHSTRNGWRESASYRDYFLGAQARAGEQGFTIEAHWAADPDLSGRRLDEILQARHIEGLIISTRADKEVFPVLTWDKFALARTGLSLRSLPCHCAVNHQFHTVRMVAAKLASRGYVRLGLVLSAWQNEAADQNWLGGYLAWQQALPASKRIPVHHAPLLTRENFLAWFRRHRPQAVICVNPDLLEWLKAEKFRVPDDVAVALLDRHDNYGDVAGADQNNLRVGAAVVDLLLAQLRHNERGIPPHPQTILIESSWHEGSTVCAAKAQTNKLI